MTLWDALRGYKHVKHTTENIDVVCRQWENAAARGWFYILYWDGVEMGRYETISGVERSLSFLRTNEWEIVK